MTEVDLERERAKWEYRGRKRPDFAIDPGPGQESVWDYPRPPRLDKDTRSVRVIHEGAAIAETSNAIRVLETASPPVFYIPPADVHKELFVAGRGSSLCEWKGPATYWSLQARDGVLENVAWSYEDPFEGFEEIRGYFSVYPARLECFVGGLRVEPQPGGFYGGWVTAEIVGPFKGDPGTGHW